MNSRIPKSDKVEPKVISPGQTKSKIKGCETRQDSKCGPTQPNKAKKVRLKTTANSQAQPRVYDCTGWQAYTRLKNKQNGNEDKLGLSRAKCGKNKGQLDKNNIKIETSECDPVKLSGGDAEFDITWTTCPVENAWLSSAVEIYDICEGLVDALLGEVSCILGDKNQHRKRKLVSQPSTQVRKRRRKEEIGKEIVKELIENVLSSATRERNVRMKNEMEIEWNRQPGKKNEPTSLSFNTNLKSRKEKCTQKKYFSKTKPKSKLNKTEPSKQKITAFFKPIRADDARGMGRELNQNELSCKTGLGCGDSGGGRNCLGLAMGWGLGGA